ncbi:hypothetical protein Trydic_g2482 [Trypoxylus dichotomus]
MAVIYLRIQGDGYKYGKYFITDDLVIEYGNLSELQEFDAVIHEITTPSRTKINNYRNSFGTYYIPNALGVNRILFDLEDTNNQIIDHKWNERISYLIRERCEVEHALSWLSTLGGAFSALGDYFENFALVAGKISYHQLVLAIRMGDPTIASRCKLYFSLSLIQRRKFKLAKRIIQAEYKDAKNAVIVDTRLIKMCLGIWSKLQYEHERHRGARCGGLVRSSSTFPKASDTLPVRKMSKNVALYIFFALVVMATMIHHDVEARYLPARGSPERLEKLRELLKEVSKLYQFVQLLENEIEKEDFADQGPRWHPESKLFYKREVAAN